LIFGRTENKWGFIIYDYDNGEEIKSGLAPNLTGITAFSNDDRYLAYATPGSSSFGIVLWDIETMKPITTLGYTSGIARDIAFSPDGKYLGVTDSDGYIKVWDLETKEKIVDNIHTYKEGENLYASGIEFTHDSQFLIVSGGYPNNSSTKIWTFPEMDLIRAYYGKLASGTNFAISPDDSLLTVLNAYYLHMLRLNYNPSSIKNKEYENDTLIIPNPIKDLLTIELQNPILNTTIVKIYDSKGVLIEQISNKLRIGSTTLSYNCSHLPAGAYFIIIEQNGNFKQYSFVKV
jgi:WD40 repeat protein